jgi:hypothetical protein
MYYDPTFYVLLYSIQICFSTANDQNPEWLESGGSFFLLSSEGPSYSSAISSSVRMEQTGSKIE